MKSSLRELQNNSFSAPAPVNTLAASNNLRMASVPQMISALREDDPAFDKVIATQRAERGQQIASPEAMASRMYVLMSGKVNLLCTNNEGRRLVIATLEPGAIFGEGALSSMSDPNVFAEAAEDVVVWVIPSSEARDMTMRHPILGWGLLQTYGMRLMQVENSLEDVAYKKLPERLASLLIDLDQDGGVIKGVSHQALADRLGTYRETVSAILRDFKRQGLVELGYRRIRLIDHETLRDVAGIWDW
ncbi:Crp/Fnr family transcriptional regulator [Caldilinea sp.]|uniref:Crp/Fnr family transcriptional regulator n=1 Tax=Caldilinea sp. TaxID=2293560 RepID=UPI002C313D41|nr:Crp/Fnr family transcriptional regulator [Anaerolineales bacterium]HQY91229.1 Crp/Fnr family transcriptional regulator [Caldilinea sp.]HRA68387.1 Crp/Fnr family transcriptional regulator [Caldilinea sp.]